MATRPSRTQHGATALTFARALMAGDYNAARTLLAPSLRSALPVTELRARFIELVGVHFRPGFVGVLAAAEDWPGKLPGDVGWAYVILRGAGYSQGLTVVVGNDGGGPLLREIGWGVDWARPARSASTRAD